MPLEARRKTALVVGATGVIGRGVVEHLQALDDWQVIGLARRPPAVSSARCRYLSLDLLDRAAAERVLPAAGDTTHLFYCGFIDGPSQAAQVAPNLTLLKHVIEDGSPSMPALERVVLLEGNKWYGSHLGPFRTPAKEDDPRCPPPMFYHDQQDFLEAFASTRPWSWTALRPQTVCGFSLGSPMNLMTAIGVYAAVRKAQGLPFSFPGKPGAYTAVYQVTDALHLAKSVRWAATAPAAADRAFNITNGDFFRWANLWPQLADFFDMECGGVEPQCLAATMPPLAPVWDEVVRRYDLEAHPMAALVKWPFADYVFGCDWDVMTATTKIRQAGFHDVVDSEEMFLELFAAFRDARIIP